MGPLLEVKNLRTSFFTKRGEAKAVDGVSFSINPGEVLGIVGESGCGKSVTSFSILNLLSHPGKIVGGSILFNGLDLVKADYKTLCKVRGNDIAMIFQDPMTSLNPVLTIGFQMKETIRAHQNVDKHRATEIALEMLNKVSIPSPEKRLTEFPHQLSGGMRQRVMIAMALSCNPALLIADEPTTALDVTIQAQILSLMSELKKSFNSAIMLITHDLGVVAENTDRIMVMYAGRVIEKADTKTLFSNPLHPYTDGLIKSVPDIYNKEDRLYSIEGTVPSLLNMPKGCKFCSRCEYACARCHEEEPPLYRVGTQYVRCYRYETEGEVEA